MAEISDVSILWASGWREGPTRGVAEYKGLHCYFHASYVDGENGQAGGYERAPWRLWLVELTEGEFEDERARHARFEELVGTECCLHLPPEERNAVRSEHEQGLFFEWDMQNPRPWYGRRQTLGWFAYWPDFTPSD